MHEVHLSQRSLGEMQTSPKNLIFQVSNFRRAVDTIQDLSRFVLPFKHFSPRQCRTFGCWFCRQTACLPISENVNHIHVCFGWFWQDNPQRGAEQVARQACSTCVHVFTGASTDRETVTIFGVPGGLSGDHRGGISTEEDADWLGV